MIRRSAAWRLVAVVAAMAGMAPAGRAQYAVDGLTLGERVPTAGAYYGSFRCRPSDRFAGYTLCERQQQRADRQRRYVAANTLLHAADGTAAYLMSLAAPVAVDRGSLEREIEELSRRFGARPAFSKWHPGERGVPTSLIVAWGEVKLEELRPLDLLLVEEGKEAEIGILVDTLGDVARSAKENRTVYRITGARGFVLSASFDRSGLGHRRHLALDVVRLASSQYARDMAAILAKDRALPSDDVRLWPEVALRTRRLTLDTSAAVAAEALDRAFAGAPAKKLHSHVWPVLPGSTILGLSAREYRRLDVYGPETKFPQIRRDLQAFVARHPDDPFVEFAHYALGELQRALEIRPNSLIREVLHYGIGHGIVSSLARDAMAAVKPRAGPELREEIGQTEAGGLHDFIGFFYRHPELLEKKPLKEYVADFAARADAARPHFEFVLRDPKAPHADDAAYMLAWLALQLDRPKEALSYFALALTVGNGDYGGPGARRAVGILERHPARELVAMVEADANLPKSAVFWYVAARSAYRAHDYQFTADVAERALKALNVPIDRLPATTDARLIERTLERIDPKFRDDIHVGELAYLLHASRELLSYEAYLEAAGSAPFADVNRRARAVITKYSLLVDRTEEPRPGRRPPEVAHKDLRQALHLIDRSLEQLPRSAEFAPLREWLHYRKVRVAVVYAPRRVAELVAAMERELPSSQLLDDALAEQLYAEGAVLKDLPAAQRTFQKLVRTHPRGNAIDNAYTWMAILLRCSGRVQEAQGMNREIIRRFPGTRHARYAVERMAAPKADACGLEAYRMQ
jgi:tetratricopeptide (TPR) repeat protein